MVALFDLRMVFSSFWTSNGFDIMSRMAIVNNASKRLRNLLRVEICARHGLS